MNTRPPPAVAGWPLIPDHPLFGLDPSQAETSRIVAPIAAALLVIMSIPLFLFTLFPAMLALPLARPRRSSRSRSLIATRARASPTTR